MTMMEREPHPLAPTSIDQHQIGQLRSQIGSLAADVRQLTQAVQKLVDTEAERAREMQAFAESATNDRGIVMQAASMLRDLASRSERQTEAITVLIDANSKLAGLVNGMLDLWAGYDRVRQLFVDRPVEPEGEPEAQDQP